MKIGLLRAGLGLATLWTVGAGACGGNVVVDGPSTGTGATGATTTTTVGTNTTTSGFGGAGGSTTSLFTSTDVATSTSTGPSCSCDLACKIAVGCGITAPSNCTQFCADLTPSVTDCICMNASNGDCSSTEACLGSFSSTAVSGSGSSGGTGGGTDQACSQCANASAQSACPMQLDACLSTPDCVAVLDCHQTCGYGPACEPQCDSPHPQGEPLFTQLIQCAVCESCSPECANLSVTGQYCVVPSPPPPSN
jgi:hypothetical protein